MANHYTEYPVQLRVLQSAPWYRVADLMAELKAIRKMNFSIVAKRQDALERLSNLSNDAPFAQNKRFPDDLYVSEAFGEWAHKFQQLKSALSHKDRDIRTQMSSSTVVREKQSSDSGSVSDALQAFWYATTEIMEMLISLDGVFTRESFESKFHLTWQ